MTRIAPHTPEPFTPARRRPLSGRDRALADSQGNRCAACGGFLGAFIADHEIPLWISGKDSGFQAICRECDKAKTRTDKGVIGHIKRLIARIERTRRERRPIPRRVNPWPQGRKLRGRPF